MRIAVLILGLAAAAAAQQPPNIPHIGYAYPAGGRQDTTFEMTIGGQFLNGASDAYLTGSGVQASVVQYIRPLTPGQANELREQMQQLVKKQAASGLTPAEQRTVAEIRQKLAEFVRRPTSPAIAETVLLQVAVARDAAPGHREMRLITSAGLTNPIDLYIGQLPEVSRKPVKVPPAFAVVNGATPPARFINRQEKDSEPPTKISLPVVLNGQMMPGASDRYRFAANKGQRIVISAMARELIPYISDAVPGWFQATLTLRDANGRELQSADHFRFHPDPVLFCEIPADGEYEFDIHDSIYRGREDFVYRITAGELPFVTGVFPLGAKAGTRAKVEARGWNLPANSIVPDTKAHGVHPVSVRKGDLSSNEVPFAVDTLPEAIAKDGANRREKAQKVKLSAIVNGRIARAGEAQFFRIDGRAGEEIVAEVYARRLDSPLDSVLRLTDAKGKELAVNDDCEDKGEGLLTHHADSRLLFKLPAKGTYYLQLADTQRKGGPDYAYRLRISHPVPEFELRVAPSSLNLRAGTSTPVTIYALRRDGFSGDIALKLKDAPPGFSLSGAAIPAGQDKVRFTITAPRSPAGTPATIQLEGRATLGGSEIHHMAVPAEDMMQAFAYRHLVPEANWMVRVIGAGAGGASAVRAASDKPIKLPAGGATTIQFLIPPRLVGQVHLALDDPPEGITIQKIAPMENGVSVVLNAAPDKVKAGLKGNLIIDAFVDRQFQNQGKNVRRRQPMGTLPAMPFEVVPK